MEKKIFVTTSWDDGHILDKQLSELLDKFSLKGTFYVPKIEAIDTLNEGDRSQLVEESIKTGSLTKEDLLDLDGKHEIGAHTLNHPYLSQLSIKDVREEIKGSKEYLEDILGHEVKMFCYPYGDFSNETKAIVKDAGFLGARTVEMGITDPPKDPFEFATTVQVYPRPRNIKLHKTYSLPQKSIFSWESRAKRLFEKVLKKGGIFHVWGHSWEVEKLEMWDRLEKIFEHVADKPDVKYLTNGECLEALGFKQHSL
ncbi:MAG: polysaccharide deacetylase family protein [Candidatus Altiarchaeota archaeon]|nr:polysaccharide deacetylase family protein [Candidatus Altiarchaeota archaeon]